MSGPTIALVPARDEAGWVGDTVRAIRGLPVDEVVVVDGGSRDGTAAEARAAGARVLSSARPLGKGDALEAALDRIPPATLYLLLDADLGATAAEAAALLDEVEAGRADLAVAALPPNPDHGGFRLVKRASAAVIRMLSGFEAAEPLSGQRALTREVLAAVRPLAGGFGLETAMTIDAVRMGFRVVEVQLPMRHRSTGRDARGFLHRGRQARDLLLAATPRALGIR